MQLESWRQEEEGITAVLEGLLHPRSHGGRHAESHSLFRIERGRLGIDDLARSAHQRALHRHESPLLPTGPGIDLELLRIAEDASTRMGAGAEPSFLPGKARDFGHQMSNRTHGACN